jgi:hypothetical protein
MTLAGGIPPINSINDTHDLSTYSKYTILLEFYQFRYNFSRKNTKKFFFKGWLRRLTNQRNCGITINAVDSNTDINEKKIHIKIITTKHEQTQQFNNKSPIFKILNFRNFWINEYPGCIRNILK